MGELHSLTDWQVSEASEEAELEDFCDAEVGRQADGEGGGERREQSWSQGRMRGWSENSVGPLPPPPPSGPAKSVCSGTWHPECAPPALTCPAARPKNPTF